MSRMREHRKVLIDFFKTGTCLSYSKGEFIIRPGETPPGVFFIEQGLVKSYDITKYGEENLLVIRQKGELLGMTAALTGDERRFIYTALSPTTVWLVKHEQLDQFLESTPEAALPLLAMVADMYRINSERILNLEYRTVRERLISFLLGMARRFGQEKPEGIVIDVPLRHQDIASSISATRETTGRELTALERRGLLSNHALCITLHDIEALKKFL
jgi:CRP/FNR family transcriptional regulator, cyclic AMP receptor protein